MNKDKYLYLKRIKERAKKLKQSQKGKTHKEILCEHRQIEKMKLFYESMPLKDQGFKPGVYFLFKDMDLVYIGESQCIMPRICQHYGQKDFDSYRIYAVMPNEKERKILERRLIKKHRPILNSAYNDNIKFRADKRQVRG
ncbi:hypothetical protein KAR91_80905 [Candidatus Pacearchaeota archaeon]|nr:hypothetical protein [Candidatus Pacearchaeota archaeon]